MLELTVNCFFIYLDNKCEYVRTQSRIYSRHVLPSVHSFLFLVCKPCFISGGYAMTGKILINGVQELPSGADRTPQFTQTDAR